MNVFFVNEWGEEDDAGADQVQDAEANEIVG